MQINDVLLATAGEYLGTAEIPGSRHNPAIVQMFADSGHSWVVDDETAWCAAFVGSVLARCGLPTTGSLAARSYLQWGEAVTQPRPGDVVVFWRGSPDSWQGHVGFFVRRDGNTIIVRGGNQGNKVSDAPYPASRLLGYRRWNGRAPLPREAAEVIEDADKSTAESKTVWASILQALGTTGGATAMGVAGNIDWRTAAVIVAGAILILGWQVHERRRKARLAREARKVAQ